MSGPRGSSPRTCPSGSLWAARAEVLLAAQRLAAYPLITLLLGGATYSVLTFFDGPRPLLPDFAARWTAARMLLSGQTGALYDPGAQSAVQAADLHSTALSWFVSPPDLAVAAIPFSALPYVWACVLWTMVSFACLAGSAWLLKPLVPPVLRRRRALLILLAAAPTLELLGSGQDTSVCLLAVALGIRLLHEDWPVAAGLALALGTIKPHLMLLVSLVLLALHAKRALLSFCAGAAALLMTGWAVVGSDGFSPLYSTGVIEGQAWKSPSLSGFLIGLPPTTPPWWLTVATILSLATTLVALAAWRAQRHTASALGLWGLSLPTTAVASPHVMLYDLVLVFPAVIWMSTSAWDATTRALLAVTYVLLWLTSSLHSVAIHLTWPFSLVGLPWGAVSILALWVHLLRSGSLGRTNGALP